MNRGVFLEFGAMLVLSIDFAAAFVFAFVWGPGAYARVYGAESSLIVYAFMILVPSMLFGTLVIDIRKILLYAIASTVIGALVAIVIISVPSMMAGELIDTTITVAISSVGRFLIIGISIIILGIVVGSFAGDRIIGQNEA